MMTEKDTLQRAKAYIDSLANGINPLTGEPVAEDDVINNVNISRCLFYVAGVLNQVSEGQITSASRERKPKFHVDAEALERFDYSSTPIFVSELVKRISALSLDGNTRRLSPIRITTWLLQKGFFVEGYDESRKKAKFVTDAGKAIGIYQEERNGIHGRYFATLYTLDAQHFIIDNLEAILT